MVSVLLYCDIDEKDELIAELYELGTTGIVEDEKPGGECTLDVFFDTRAEAEALVQQMAARRAELRDHGDRDYVAEFQAQWHAMPIGKRLWLSPPWDATAPPDGRLRVDYQPGMACGSGAHPCTRLCLQALENCVGPGSAVLDIGVGSGILLLAAHALGATVTVGCDIDHDSVVLAAQTLAGSAALFTGSARSAPDRSFDVVIANISSIAAEQLHDDMRRIARPGATILVSGFRIDDWPNGYTGERLELEGWGAVIERIPPR